MACHPSKQNLSGNDHILSIIREAVGETKTINHLEGK